MSSARKYLKCSFTILDSASMLTHLHVMLHVLSWWRLWRSVAVRTSPRLFSSQSGWAVSSSVWHALVINGWCAKPNALINSTSFLKVQL